MAELTVQKVNYGLTQLDSQNISPFHKRAVESCLTKIISKEIPNATIKDIPFHLKLSRGQPELTVSGRKIALDQNADLRAVASMVRYHQNTGQLPRGGSEENVVERQAATKQAVHAVNTASIPGTNGAILAGMRIAEDTLSLTRNILFAIPSIGPNNSVVNHLGYYASLFWTFFAFRELDSGITEYKRSRLIGDAEGKRRSYSRILSGGIVSTGAVTYLAGRIFDTFSCDWGTKVTLGSANALFGIGSLLAMGVSAVGALRCYNFNERLNTYLENTSLTQAQRIKGALQFLKDAISVTAEERKEMIEKIEKECPDWTPEKKNQLLDQRLRDLTEVKVKYMKRRTSNKSLYLILTQADAILAKLADKSTEGEGIKDGLILLHTIQEENKTKMALYILGVIAAMISFIAMLTATFFTAGALPFVLYGIAGAIYLGMTVYNIAGMVKQQGPQKRELEYQHMQDLGDLSPHEHHMGF